jgi:hypothetical protein
MSFRGGDFSTGEMRNFQPALTFRFIMSHKGIFG